MLECKRSDKDLFDFYASLIVGGTRFDAPMTQVIAEARKRFVFNGFCRSNLVISHSKRIQLNARINRELASSVDAKVELTVTGRSTRARSNSEQTMFIWPGIQLMGSVPTER